MSDEQAVADPPAQSIRAAGMPQMPSLDGLRALAILIVMASHVGLGRIIPGGFGVTVFFFLSGYLITTLLRIESERFGRIDLRRFYWKRTLRIFPPLYLTILAASTLVYFGHIDRPISFTGLTADVLFLTNYSNILGLGPGIPAPLWSLDVEEHFYLVFATLFAFGFVRLRAKRAALICVLLALGVLIIRSATVIAIDAQGGDVTAVYYWSHTRVDSILWGSVLALWRNPATTDAPLKPSKLIVAGALAVLLATLLIRDPIFRETIRYTLQGAALLVLFSFALLDRGLTAKALGSKPMRGIAAISYTLYLAHVPALAWAEHNGVNAIMGIGLTFAYAALMYFFIEKPLGRIRRGS